MEIKNIYKEKNIKMYNEHNNLCTINRKGIITIEYENGEKKKLDLRGCADITNCDFIILQETKKTKRKYIFKSLRFDEKRLEKLTKKTLFGELFKK